MYVVKHWFMKCLTFVYQVYCVYFSVKYNVMTTCPTAPIFLAELRLGPAGLCKGSNEEISDDPMICNICLGGPRIICVMDCFCQNNLPEKIEMYCPEIDSSLLSLG